MSQLNFYPEGNADSCFTVLAGGRLIVVDFADMKNRDDDKDKRADLEEELRTVLDENNRTSVSVLALTHLDNDHVKRTSEVFWLEHAAKHQSKDRIKIDELWVPAAAICEDGVEDEARILRQEARHRLRVGRGIRVFSYSEALDAWFKDNGIDPATRRHLITDAGQIVPGFGLTADGVEFFVHSPFRKRTADGVLIERNNAALFFQMRFLVDTRVTDVLLTADVDYDVLDDIVDVTRKHKNDDRLRWDVANVPHHTSYLSLGPEKGKEKTKPTANVAWLYERQGQKGGILVSTSQEIPSSDTVQPPHRQAAAYYQDVAGALGGEWVVTMEHPSIWRPGRLKIDISSCGAKLIKASGSAAAAITGGAAPRAG